MEELDARDLGPLLICECDFALADSLGIELKRSKTRMQGDGAGLFNAEHLVFDLMISKVKFI